MNSDENKIEEVLIRLDGINFCQTERDCTEPTEYIFVNPVNGELWRPCKKHLQYYQKSFWEQYEEENF